MSSKKTLRDVQEALSVKLDEIQKLWTKPMRVTLLVRDPTNPEGEVVIGDDSIDDAIAAMERAKARPAIQ